MRSLLFLLIATIYLFGQSGPTIYSSELLGYQFGSNGNDIRSISMGESMEAAGFNISALHFNPATLARLKKIELSLGIEQYQFNKDIQVNNQLFTPNKNRTKVKNIGIAVPFPTYRGSFVVGFSYHKLKNFDELIDMSMFSQVSNGLNLEYELNGTMTTGIFDANVERSDFVQKKGDISKYAFGAAIDAAPTTSVGLSLNLYRGINKYYRLFQQYDSQQQFQTPPSDFDSYREENFVNNEYSGASITVGVSSKLSDNLFAGFSIESPHSINVNEDWLYEWLFVFDDAFEISESGSGIYDYSLKLPMKLSIGGAYINDRMTLASSLVYQDLSQAELDGDGLNEDNRDIAINFTSYAEVKIGAEFRFLDGRLDLRTGYRYMKYPYANQENLNRNIFSGGIGYLINDFLRIDLGLTYYDFEQTISEDPLFPDLMKETNKITQLLIGLVYRY
ncbi:MAG: hypothetical protein Kow00108_04070 [Calditrichia bacterium]